MATENKENKATENKENKAKKETRVPVYIEKGNSSEEPNLLVSVNGKNYLLPKGKESLVPPEVAYEINRSRRAQQRVDKRIDEMQEAMAEKAKEIK